MSQPDSFQNMVHAVGRLCGALFGFVMFGLLAWYVLMLTWLDPVPPGWPMKVRLDKATLHLMDHLGALPLHEQAYLEMLDKSAVFYQVIRAKYRTCLSAGCDLNEAKQLRDAMQQAPTLLPPQRP